MCHAGCVASRHVTLRLGTGRGASATTHHVVKRHGDATRDASSVSQAVFTVDWPRAWRIDLLRNILTLDLLNRIDQSFGNSFIS